MNNRAAETLKPFTRAGIKPPAALQAVVCYAAQNPGFDPHDYGDAASMRSDQRRAYESMHDVREAVRECFYSRVTDADMLEAAPRAFSGRLEVTPTTNSKGEPAHRIDYCTGQYWPTEYRAACAAVLMLAAKLAYERDEAERASMKQSVTP